MMTGMDDRDDPESDLTLEAMAGLSKILAVVDETNVRHIFINICLRIRPCFDKVTATFIDYIESWCTVLPRINTHKF